MQKNYHQCAALLLAVGLLFPCTTALAQMPEESSMVIGLSSVDSGVPPTLDNGVVLVVWEPEACYIEVGATLDRLPSTVKITAGYKSDSGGVMGDPKEYSIGIHWDIASVDCAHPGIYNITGTLDSDALSALGIANSDGLTAALTVAVEKPGPIEALSGKLMSMNETYMQLRLRFPVLPDDATALYLERETEPGVWERLSVPGETDAVGNPQTNFLQFSPKNPPEQFIAYRLAPPVPQLRLRIEVVGSLYAGISNEVEIFANGDGNTLPPPVKPEDKPDNDDDDDDDDGSAGGNRGGSTQGETDRPGKVEEEEKPKETAQAPSGSQASAPIAAPPESGAASAAFTIPDLAESTPSASGEPQTQEVLAPAEEPPAEEPQPPPDNGNAGAVAATTTAILIAGAGGIYLFKQGRKP